MIGFLLANIMVDFLGESGNIAYEDWIHYGRFGIEMKENLIVHKQLLIDRIVDTKEMVKNVIEDRFSHLPNPAKLIGMNNWLLKFT